jgi:hypothetical protein
MPKAGGAYVRATILNPEEFPTPSAGGGTTSDATAANQVTTNDRIGPPNETPPTTDTASSALNGRLQRLAQRLTSLIGLFPASLGPKTAAASFSVTPATDALYTTVDRGSGSIATGQVQVNNTAAVQVVAARPGRRSVTLAPSTQFTYFVGNAGVTTANGFPVLNGGAVTVHSTGAVFVIANSTGPMGFMETF